MVCLIKERDAYLLETHTEGIMDGMIWCFLLWDSQMLIMIEAG